MTLDKLYKIILDRKMNLPKGSYTASLFKEGKDRIIQKVGEESTEVVIAAKNENKTQIIYEVADLWFHILILLAEMKITPREILDELEKRRIKAV
ncbi:phosphoribosyl-ATP diphosphatase [Patescibacteria group bacterium]|nr:phosphoribosyl-ATP diphosphatase [Patescibacteria group bacterium]MBU4017323.1 phosphoribosyl-ATP diphosphatase [Patescibacteria group bacterium]MBU4099600.1 phosphoribosyl-ATP diphosphatase [Patescibacteria group bacterium]